MMERALRTTVVLLVFLASFILQTTLLPLLQFHGVTPDLLLVLIVLTGLFSGSARGGAVGFAVGLLEDLLTGRYLGLAALSGFLTGYAVGYLEGRFYRENPIVPLFLVFLGSLLFNGIFFIGREVIGAFSGMVPSMLWMMLLAALYNTILAAILYRPLYLVFLRSDSAARRFFGEFLR